MVQLAFADPYMLSTVGKWFVDERVAIIYKYIKKDLVTYPVMEIITDKTNKRTWNLPSKKVDIGQDAYSEIKELKDVFILQTEEKPHNLGCLPVVELRNKHK